MRGDVADVDLWITDAELLPNMIETLAVDSSAVLAGLREALIKTTPEALYQWACHLDECDGSPHDGADYKHVRTSQRAPKGDWFVWLLLCGRGFGKIRTGSEVFLEVVIAHPVDEEGIPTEWLIAGPTYDDTV